VSNSYVGQPLPLWGYDATPQLPDRKVVIFAYDDIVKRKTRPLNFANIFEFLSKKIDDFHGSSDISQDHKDRLGRAVRSFRRALADTDDILDEFQIHWSALETLDGVYSHVYGLESKPITRPCKNCQTPAIITRQHSGIEDVFIRLHKADNYERLRKLRNGISHGYMSLSECVVTAAEHIQIIRKAILSMILRVIRADESVHASVLLQEGYKGNVIPHFRMIASGDFDPGDPKRLDTHPEISAQTVDMTVIPTGLYLTLQPNISFSCTNTNLNYHGMEIWASPEAQLKIVYNGDFLEVTNSTQVPPIEAESGDGSSTSTEIGP